MADISTITTLDGTIYNLKDANARAKPIVYLDASAPITNLNTGDLWFIVEEETTE